MTKIHKTVKQSLFSATIELIDVPVQGEPIVLLRAQEMPEYAFVMWAENHHSTADQMAFKMPGNHSSNLFTVVCACCEASWSEKTPEQEKACAVNFQEALKKTCNAYNIHTIFMRRARAWEENPKGLRIIETDKYLDALLDDYGRKIIRTSLQFIDYYSSRGLGRES